jgi:asparagine synthetase B (glutamine-hydrolysing)
VVSGLASISNEMELRRICGVANGSVEDVLRIGYRRFGIRLAPYLRGTFALAILDYESNALTLIRDHIGRAPLFVTIGNGVVAWSSASRLLVTGETVEWNVDLLADYLSGGPLAPYETALRGVYQIPPGSGLTIGRNGASLARWWRTPPPCSSAVNGDALEEFEEVFLASLTDELAGVDADRCAVRLSGGYDSTSVLLGLKLLGVPIRSASIVFPTELSNEQRYLDYVGTKFEMETTRVVASALEKEQLSVVRGPCVSPFREPYEDELAALARDCRASGWSVLLTGIYGDEFMGPFTSIDDLEAQIGAEILRRREGYRLASRFLNELGRQRFRDGFLRHLEIPEWIQSEALNVFLGWGSTLYGEVLYNEAVCHDLDLRHPFLSARMMEFSARLSPDSKTNEVKFKPLLAAFLARHGLDQIGARGDKADLSDFWRRCCFPAARRELRSEAVRRILEEAQIFDLAAVECSLRVRAKINPQF